MPTVFSRIIDGDLPARFVWRDERCVAFLDGFPLRPGHTLVVPRREVDRWFDLEPELMLHITGVAHQIARAIQHAFHPTTVGFTIAGLEVPHAHIHLVPMDSMRDLSYANRDRHPDPGAQDRVMETIRSALHELGVAGSTV